MKKDTSLMNSRHFEILNILPKHPDSMTVKQIRERWGTKRDERTIQRILQDLADEGKATFNKEGRTNKWSRLTDAKTESQEMSRQNAFAIKTSEPFLNEIIPKELRPQFDLLFNQATTILSKEEDKTPWQDKFVLEAPEFPPSKEQIDHDIKELVLKAVLEEESIQIKYQRPGREANWRVLFPYGVILSKSTQYLVGAGLKPFDEGQAHWQKEEANSRNIRVYAMHRILDVKTSSEQFQKVSGFDLREVANSGVTNWKIGFQDIKARLIAKGAVAQILLNADLEDLTTTNQEDGKCLFEFLTPFTFQFVKWCISHAYQLQVLGPDILLKEIGKQIRDPRSELT